jgi:hypothetical protein
MPACRSEPRHRAGGGLRGLIPYSNVRSPQEYRFYWRFSISRLFQQVPAEELSVTPQHPFRGGVSGLQPVQSTVLFTRGGTDARTSCVI